MASSPSSSTPFVNPRTGKPLHPKDGDLVDDDGARFPIIAGIPRFCEIDNYSASFGLQWNLFQRTQIDGEGVALPVSATRLFIATDWEPKALAGLDVLEV